MTNRNLRQSPRSPDRLRTLLVREITRFLPRYLELRFASPREVSALVCHRLSFSELSAPVLDEVIKTLPDDPEAFRDWLRGKVDGICRSAAVSRYVKDCELIAQHDSPQTTDDSRERIRNYYWQSYFDWADRTLRAVLLKHLGRRKAEVLCAQAQDSLEAAVFSKESFGRCASQYRAEQGKSFEEFLKWLIIRRCTDCVKKLVKAEERFDGAVREFGAVKLVPPCWEAAGRVRETIMDCLAGLKDRGGPGEEMRGVRERAAIELRYRAYLDVDDMAPQTLRMVEKRFVAGIAALRADYLQSLDDLRLLVDKRLTDAVVKADTLFARADMLRTQLERDGRSLPMLDLLSFQASRNDFTRDRTKREAAPADGRDAAGRLEIDYVKACRRHLEALHALEETRRDWSDWCNYRGRWVRSETDIAGLMGVSQPTISRALKAAGKFFRTFRDLAPSG